MMVEWRPKHVGANKRQKKFILLVELLVFSLTVHNNARYRTHKTEYTHGQLSYLCTRESGWNLNTRWFKYDRDDLCVNKSQFVPVIFEPPCTNTMEPDRRQHDRTATCFRPAIFFRNLYLSAFSFRQGKIGRAFRTWYFFKQFVPILFFNTHDLLYRLQHNHIQSTATCFGLFLLPSHLQANLKNRVKTLQFTGFDISCLSQM
jgi:hypothetical protein